METLLRLERSYEVRRAAKLTEGVEVAKMWPADAVLIDARLLPPDGRVALGVPSLVVAASETEGAARARILDDARGWVASDAAAPDLVRSVETMLTRAPEAAAGTVALVGLALLAAILAALFLYLLWIALV